MMQEVAKSLYGFFSGFGLPAYVTDKVFAFDEQGKEISVKFPYITYDLAVGKTFQSTSIACKLYYLSKYSLAAPLAKADEIYDKIKNGAFVPCGNGYLWIYPGNPFAQPAPDDNQNVSAVYLNINITYDLN